MTVAEVGNTVVFEKSFLQRFINEVTKTATETAIKVTRIEMMKDVELSTNKASIVLGVSAPTVIKYCAQGHRKAGKLSHKKEGEKYIINRYDLEMFKEKMQQN